MDKKNEACSPAEKVASLARGICDLLHEVATADAAGEE